MAMADLKIYGENKILSLASAVFIIVSCLVVYMPAMKGEFIWDDDTYITQNPLITAPDGLYRIWFSKEQTSQYFPLVYTTFRLEHKLWGFNPLGYHITNILLHIINSLLLWRLLRLLDVPGAWLAAAIFALHPVQVESVAWITERKNVLMTLFFFLSLMAWVRFMEKPAIYLYFLSLVFYALALFSKTTACTLPAALVLILWIKRIPIDKRAMAANRPVCGSGPCHRNFCGLAGALYFRNKQAETGIKPRRTAVAGGTRTLVLHRQAGLADETDI